MENIINTNPQIKNKNKKLINATQAREGGGELAEVQTVLQSPLPIFAGKADFPPLGKIRRLRKRDARNAPVPSRKDAIAHLSSMQLSPVVRMDKLRVVSVEDASNMRVAMAAAREPEGTAPTPYEEFLTPTLEEDYRPGPSYYSEATCARTAGARSDSMERLLANGKDDQMEDMSIQEGSEIVVTDLESAQGEEEVEEEKRGPGRPATVGTFVGIREKREEEKAQKAEAELEQRAKEALTPDAPTGVRWRKLLDKEEEKEEELRGAPTEDIASRLLEHSAILFKTADCSNKMKGALVGQMKDTVVFIRAATTVLTRRMREKSGTSELLAFRRQLEEVRAENRRLREEVEQLKARDHPDARKAPASPQRTARRVAASKRRRVIESDEDSDPQSQRPPCINNDSDFPPLPTPLGERRKKIEGRDAQYGQTPAVLGPSLQGKARPIEAIPLGMSKEDERTLAKLREQRDNILSQLDPVLERLSQLEVSARDKNLEQLSSSKDTAPVSPQVPAVIGEEARTSKPQGIPKGEPKKAPPAALATQVAKTQAGGNRKKGKKARRGQGPPSQDTRPTDQGKERENPPNPKKGQPRPNEGKPQPSLKKKDVVKELRGNNPSTSEKKKNSDARGPAPPPPAQGATEEWSLVSRRKSGGKKTAGNIASKDANPPANENAQREGKKAAVPRQQSAQAVSSSAGKRPSKSRRRVPRTAAVVITCPPGQYRDTLRLATSQIDPASLGIKEMKARRAVTGAQIFEIGGPDKQEKADALAARIREVLADRDGVKVTRPLATAELRVRDLHDAIVEEDVRKAIASATDCNPGAVSVGPIRPTGRGLNTVWVRCPLAAANKLSAAGKLLVGWTRVRVEALEKRPLQCFKCLGKGHVRANCSSGADRSSCCYKCGQEGHLARDCALPVRCPVCADLGRPTGHRAGSRACSAPKSKGKGGAMAPPLSAPAPVMERPTCSGEKTPCGEEAMEVEHLPQRQPRKREGVQPVTHPEETQDPSPDELMEVMPEELSRQE